MQLIVSDKLRIAIVQGPFFPIPPLRAGAVEKIWHALAEEFAARGHSVTHISRTFQDLPLRESVAGVKHIRVRGYDAVKSFVRSKYLDLLYSIRAWRMIPDCDIVVTHTFWLPILMSFKRNGRPTYVHAARMPRGQMFLYRHVHRIQTVSYAVAGEIARQCPSLRDRLRVIPNFAALPALGANSLPYQFRAKELLFVGRIHPEKGLATLLRAFELFLQDCPEWRLRIIGSFDPKDGGGGDNYRDELLSACSEKARSAIIWQGPVYDTNHLTNAYASARIFIYPSIAERGESFAVAPLEAMSNGTPPIVSNLACMQDFIEDKVNALVFDHRAPEPEVALCRAMVRLSRDAHLASNLAKNGLTTAERFSLSVVADRYLQDFNDVVESIHEQ